MIYAVLALVLVAAFYAVCGAFCVGVWASTEIIKTFEVRWEERASRRVALALQEQGRKQLERQQAIERWKAQHQDLTPDQENIMSEEIEAALSAGPGRRG